MIYVLEVHRDGVTIFEHEIVLVDAAIFPAQVKEGLEAFLVAHPGLTLIDHDIGIVVAPVH